MLTSYSLIVFAFFIAATHQGPNERLLLKNLLAEYNPLERPVLNESEPVSVSMGITLVQIIDVNEKNQQIVTLLMIQMEWIDANLRWNISQYGGVTDVRIPASRIWKPDILLYNSADERIDSAFPVNVVVGHNGSCKWLPPGIYRSTCKIDITWFPFDDQICHMKFGSWSYAENALDLRLLDERGADTSVYTENGEWILLGVPGNRTAELYPCCADPYIDLKYFIHLRRRTLYYGFNLIVPCMIISSMCLLGFSLPPECGEKLTLGVTILLSMTVFMLQLSENLPPTSESVSIVGTYFACIMMVVACSVVMTVVVLNFHHKTPEQNEMNKWVKVAVLKWLARLLRMKRPDQPKAPKRQSSPCSKPHHPTPATIKDDICNANGPLKDFGDPMDHPISMDYDDDYMQLNSLRLSGRSTCNYCGHFNSTTSTVGRHGHGHHFLNHVHQVFPHRSYPHLASVGMPNCCDETGNELINSGRSCGSATEPASSVNTTTVGLPVACHNCIMQNTGDSAEILQEMRFITNRMRKEDEIHDIIQDWRFAGIIIDRLCLILFTAFTVISTVVCLSSAPHLIV